jgi:hypothetical protein
MGLPRPLVQKHDRLDNATSTGRLNGSCEHSSAWHPMAKTETGSGGMVFCLTEEAVTAYVA